MTALGELRIGPLALRYRAQAAFPAIHPPAAYRPFFRTVSPHRSDEPAVLGALDVALRRETAALPGGEPDFSASRHWRLYRQGGELWFATDYGRNVFPRRVCRVTEDLSRCDLFVDPRPPERDPRSIRIAFPPAYPIDQILSWGLLAQIGGVLLHAALVVRPDGAGLLLAGRSGAGKSTLANLCAAAGWTVLNDDRALVYFENGRALAAGTPWHGSGRHAVPGTVPLADICFPAKSNGARLEALDRPALRDELLRAAAVPWFIERWTTPTLAVLDRLMSGVPARRLHFRPDASAVALLRDIP